MGMVWDKEGCKGKIQIKASPVCDKRKKINIHMAF